MTDILERVASRAISLCLDDKGVDKQAVKRLLKSGLSLAERDAIKEAGVERLEGLFLTALQDRRHRPRLQISAKLLPPPMEKEALYRWYHQDISDAKLNPRARVFLGLLCSLASEDLAPMAYTIKELSLRLCRQYKRTRAAAEEAAAAGYIKLDGESVILIDPRERKVAPKEAQSAVEPRSDQPATSQGDAEKPL